MSDGSMSFFFFDFDSNIMKVKVNVVLVNDQTGEETEIPAGVYYGGVKDQIGQPGGEWADWSDRDATRYYGDLTPAQLGADGKQPFVKQIETAIQGDPARWQAPAWKTFVYACNHARPMSLITARGHGDATIMDGFRVLRDHGHIERLPEFLSIYCVANPDTMKALGDPDGSQEVAERKETAILQTVEAALAKYGAAPRHRFGMSDDTMSNVEQIVDTMRVCKERHPDKRFFVISTNREHLVKMEIFPASFPVTGHPAPACPLSSHLHD